MIEITTHFRDYYFKLILFCLALSGGLSSAAAAPISALSDAEIGQTLYDEITAKMAIYTNKKLLRYVTRVGNNIASVSDKSSQKFTFTVIDSPDINAFATPGGFIYINRGLISYLQSEAQLAAVLAHEIAHVTANHAAKQKRANSTNKIFAGFLGVLTGSGDIAEASSMWGSTMVSGYGRDMELEADQVGAQYLYRANYAPEAMIDVISILKDNERFAKLRAKQSGTTTQNYHGLFASHPKNDKRLKEVIKQAGSLPDNVDAKDNVTPFRIATEGLTWGENFTPVERKHNRFYQDTLHFRFDYPEGWHFKEAGKSIMGSDEKASLKMRIEILPRSNDSPDQYVKTRLNIPLVKKSEHFSQAKMPGYRGFIPGVDGKADQRFALLYYRRHAYVFRGESSASTGAALSSKQLSDNDKIFLTMINSFRPLSKQTLTSKKPKAIHYVKAKPRLTFKKLARHLKMQKYGEAELRLINGYYPQGEPQTGAWIKIIR